MEFAPNKSKVLIVHQRSLAPSKRTPRFSLAGDALDIVSEFSYLGIIVSQKGRVGVSFSRPYDSFLQKTIKKARKRAGLVSLLGTHMGILISSYCDQVVQITGETYPRIRRTSHPL